MPQRTNRGESGRSVRGDRNDAVFSGGRARRGGIGPVESATVGFARSERKSAAGERVDIRCRAACATCGVARGGGSRGDERAFTVDRRGNDGRLIGSNLCKLLHRKIARDKKSL